MSAIIFANLAYMVVSACTAKRHADHAGEALTQHQRLQVDGSVFAGENQLRQFSQNIRQITYSNEMAVDMKSWPLVNSPALVSKSLSQQHRRPLLVMLILPPTLKGASADQYISELKKFASTHFKGALGGVKFQTGLWTQGRELDDAAVSSLQVHLPDQPMALFSFALRTGDRVEPRFAYLPGPGGLPTEVMSFCKDPIEIGSLVQTTERKRALDRRDVVMALSSAGFQMPEINQLLGPIGQRNALVDRAEHALSKAGTDIKLQDVLDENFTTSRAGLTAVEDGIIQLLKIALLITADAHNLLTHRLSPKLPELLPELRKAMAPVVAAALDNALDGYEQLFTFPAIANFPATAIARARLAVARAELNGVPDAIVVSIAPWAAARGFATPSAPVDCLDLLVRNAAPSDAGFVEVLGLLLEQGSEDQMARQFYDLASSLRIRGASSFSVKSSKLNSGTQE